MVPFTIFLKFSGSKFFYSMTTERLHYFFGLDIIDNERAWKRKIEGEENQTDRESWRLMAKLCFHFYLPTKTTRFLTFCVYHIHNSRTSSQDILNYRFGYLFFYQDIQKTYINFFKSHFLLYLHVSVSSYVSCISSSNKFLNAKKQKKTEIQFNVTRI